MKTKKFVCKNNRINAIYLFMYNIDLDNKICKEQNFKNFLKSQNRTKIVKIDELTQKFN